MTSNSTTARLEIRDLHVRFGRREALVGLNLDVGPGELLAVMGPNGSGKSTAIAAIAGLVPWSGGEMAFEGAPAAPGDVRLRASLGVVFQRASLDVKLTARENLLLSLRMHGVTGPAARARIVTLLDIAGLAGRADEPLKQLSGGMRRRVDIVRAIAHHPRLVVLDEPTTGLDEASFRRVWEAIEQLRVSEGVSIIVATHRADEAARCDRVVVVHEGRAVANATPAALIDGVASDWLRITSRQPDAVRIQLRRALGLDAIVEGRELVVPCSRGAELIVRVVEAVPRGQIDAIALVRPTLAEVFLRLTGASLLSDGPTEPTEPTGPADPADPAGGEGAGPTLGTARTPNAEDAA
jgi:ABC-2 type transport system ATP-binding protein